MKFKLFDYRNFFNFIERTNEVLKSVYNEIIQEKKANKRHVEEYDLYKDHDTSKEAYCYMYNVLNEISEELNKVINKTDVLIKKLSVFDL